MFLRKSACRVSRVLDINDCPLHNIVHDVALFPKYYDPLYHPHCHPELFNTPVAVKNWIEGALNSHISLCPACRSKGNSSIKFSVQWRDSYFVVCSYLNGRIKQCMVTLKVLESCKYTHCWLFSRLHGKCFPLKVLAALPLESTGTFNIIANEEPAWLFHSDMLYHSHLSPLAASILAMAVKSCSEGPDNQAMPRQKAMYVSKIIDHFSSERHRYILACRAKPSATSRVDVCSFVERMERLYGQDVSALLRELPFIINPQVNRESIRSDKPSWFNETVEELASRLHSFSMESILLHIKKIPAHRRPAYISRSRPKTLNSLADHVLRRVSYLFSLRMASLCEIVLALDPRLSFEQEPSRETLIIKIVGYEYGHEILERLSTPPLSRNDQRKLNRRVEKDTMIQSTKEELDVYKAAWPSQISQELIFECLNAYRQGTIWKDPPICAVCGQGSSDVKLVHFGGDVAPS